MGCNCCRMLNREMFKPHELQTNGYINEGHVYEHDHSKSPTIKISDRINVGQNIIEQDGFTGLQDPYNVPQKIIARNDETDSSDPTTVSSYAILNSNFVGDTEDQNSRSSPFDNLEKKTNTLEETIDFNKVSDEPECIQHELCNSIQENSLTESAIMEVGGSNLILDPPRSISNSCDLNELPKNKDFELQMNMHIPDKSSHDSIESTACTAPRSKEAALIALMIERSTARGSKKSSGITSVIQQEDAMDPDVAEALEALAAAIAGEEFEDS
ncbi:uncharacterized protein PAF06_012738 [Gastrophryne carolinensis]